MKRRKDERLVTLIKEKSRKEKVQIRIIYDEKVNIVTEATEVGKAIRRNEE